MQKLSASPKWVRFLMIVAVYTILMLGQSLLTGEGLEPERIIVTIVMGLAVAAAFLWIVRWQRARESKKPEGYPTASNFRSALSSGRLPTGATAEHWIPELVKAICQERIVTWPGTIFFGGLAVMGVFLIKENPDYPWFWIISTVFFAGLAIWYPIWVPRRRRKMEALISQLQVSTGEDQNYS